MEITNEIIGESFSYDYSKKPLTCRISEQMALNEILEFCININEKAVYSDDLLSVEVEEETFLYELLYGLKSGRSRDGTAFLQEMMNKKSKKKSNGSTGRRIWCSCGRFSGAAATIQEYAYQRQGFLRMMQDHKSYGQFMRTCFPNSVFADDCEQELAYIEDFEEHIEEITDCLALLDEKAITLYYKYQTNLAEAQRVLQSLLQKTCAPDPKHKKYLQFEFSYEQEVDGEMKYRSKMVECQPHFKLIRDDSNLRVYFWWKDDDIGAGKKVLIGRVGRHPWKK